MNSRKSVIKLMITTSFTNQRLKPGMIIKFPFDLSSLYKRVGFLTPSLSFFLENFDPNGKDLTPLPLIIPMVLSNSLMKSPILILQSMGNN